MTKVSNRFFYSLQLFTICCKTFGISGGIRLISLLQS